MASKATKTSRAIAIAFALLTTSAWAQQNGVDYATAMRQGSELYEKGDIPGAIQIWEHLVTSLGEDRAWKVLYNLGLAYQAVGDPTRAVESFEAFVKRSRTTAGKDIELAREDANERIRAIKSSHGAVRVAPPKGGSAVLVRIGASAARPAGFTVYLAPGDHAIEVHSGTANARSITVHATAGAATELVVPEVATSKPSLPPPPPPQEKRGFPTGWLLGGAAVTLASGALPLVFGLRAGDSRDDAEALGAGSTRYADARSDFESARTTYHLTYIVPAVLATATAVIVILQLPSKSTTASSTWSGLVRF